MWVYNTRKVAQNIFINIQQNVYFKSNTSLFHLLAALQNSINLYNNEIFSTKAAWKLY